MLIRKLDANGDMTFGFGAGNFMVNSPEAVAQAVSTRLKLFQGEWFTDITAGVPYETKVIGFNNVHHFNFVIKEAILGTTGVTGISAYYSFIDQFRNVTINATIDTLYGKTTLNFNL
jgi:hypothetical protein